MKPTISRRDRGWLPTVQPVPRGTWRQFYAADPAAVLTQAPEWIDCICSGGRYTDASRLYELPSGRRVLVPLVTAHAGLRSLSAASWPDGWAYGGPLMEGGGQPTAEEARLVLTDLAARSVGRVTLAPAPPSNQCWQHAGSGIHGNPRRAQILDLASGYPAVRDLRFSRHVRRQLRRAEREGVEIASDTSGRLLPVFADLYRASSERWARDRGQPRRLARATARFRDRPGQVAAATRFLPAGCTIWVCTRRGEPIAANVVLSSVHYAHHWLAGVDYDLARQTGGSYLLMASMIETACNAGVQRFNMGESDPDGPIERHKLQFGAVNHDYSRIVLERLPFSAAQSIARRGIDHVLATRL